MSGHCVRCQFDASCECSCAECATAKAIAEKDARIRELEAALAECSDALRTVASCHACECGITLGFANCCIDCPAEPEAKDAEVDLDKVVQAAWERARAVLPQEVEKA